jgi:formylglycine-generating enzyme required for sulfatase activity
MKLMSMALVRGIVVIWVLFAANLCWGDTIQDCPECPMMVVIPAGSFQMGKVPGGASLKGNAEPSHPVTIKKPFAIGIYTITWKEWNACVAAARCRQSLISNDRWRGDDKPVTFVTWSNAQRYANWLSEKTGKKYRLTSEAEWEYATRAGTVTARYWGDDIGVDNANCRGCNSRWDDEPAPVGSFKPNPWGLYDTLGNVHQWTADCWHPDYIGAPDDGSAWDEPDCLERVIRGGAALTDSRGSRADYRVRHNIDAPFSLLGFRLARDLE